MSMIKGKYDLIVREFRLSKNVNHIPRIGSIIYAYKLESGYSDDKLTKIDSLIMNALEKSGYKVEKDPFYKEGRSEAEWIDYLGKPTESIYINAAINPSCSCDIAYKTIVVKMYNMRSHLFVEEAIPVFDDFPEYEASETIDEIDEINGLIEYWNTKKYELYDVVSAFYVRGNVLETPIITKYFYKNFKILQNRFKSLYNIQIVAYNEVTWKQLLKDNKKPTDSLSQAIETRKYIDGKGIDTFAIIENSEKCASLSNVEITDYILTAFEDISNKANKN